MTGVFVSYAREDAAKAKAIATQIEQAGFEIWFDERIHSGSEFTREIEGALASAAIVLVLWSAHSVNSAWVRDEAAEGRDSGRLVPVMLDDSRPPIGFRQFQSTDMSGWSGRGRPKQIHEVIEAIRAKRGSTAPTAIAELRPSLSWTSTIARSAAVLGVMIAALLIYLLVGRPAQAPDAAPSVALLPFTTESSDPEIRQIASATHDAVAHTLAQGELSIRVIDSLPKDGTPAADFVLTGQLSSASDKIVATVRMDETTHHFVVYSYQFEGSRKEAEDFAERVGAQVAGQLSWTAPLLAVERKHPSDSAVTASLLQASSTGLAGSGTLHDYENSRRLAQSAPNSPLAQSSFAINTAFALDQLPREERAEAVAAGRKAADRALAIAPEFGDAYFAWCQLQNPAALAACEDKLRGGTRAAPDAPMNSWLLSAVLNEVGRNRESLDLARVSLAHDQYMMWKLARMVEMLEATGKPDQAATLYQQATRWWPESSGMLFYRFNGILQRGDFNALARFAAETGDKARVTSVLAAINARSILAVRSACSGATQHPRLVCMLGLAQLGDLDTAFALAERIYPSRIGKNAEETDRIWLDDPDGELLAYMTSAVGAPMRRDPRYIALAQRTGLLEYWRKGRLPDFCQPPRPEPVCAQIRRR